MCNGEVFSLNRSILIAKGIYLIILWNLKNDLWLNLLKNTSFQLFALQPSTGKMIKRWKILGVKYKVKIKNADN